MLEHPVLVNRPIVCIPKGEHEKAVSLPLGRVEANSYSDNAKETVKLCRPSEAVLDILPVWPQGPFAKEDGTPLIDQDGKRII